MQYSLVVGKDLAKQCFWHLAMLAKDGVPIPKPTEKFTSLYYCPCDLTDPTLYHIANSSPRASSLVRVICTQALFATLSMY